MDNRTTSAFTEVVAQEERRRSQSNTKRAMSRSASVNTFGRSSDWGSQQRGGSANSKGMQSSYSQSSLHRAPRRTLAQVQGRRAVPVHRNHQTKQETYDPITGEPLVPVGLDWTHQSIPRNLHSNYHTLPSDTQGHVKRHPYTHVPMVTRDEYIMQRISRQPYQSGYLARNASAGPRAAADIGFGRFKMKTGQVFDNMANYDDRVYGAPNVYTTDIDIISGEKMNEPNEPNEPWAITTKRYPTLANHTGKYKAGVYH